MVDQRNRYTAGCMQPSRGWFVVRRSSMIGRGWELDKVKGVYLGCRLLEKICRREGCRWCLWSCYSRCSSHLWERWRRWMLRCAVNERASVKTRYREWCERSTSSPVHSSPLKVAHVTLLQSQQLDSWPTLYHSSLSTCPATVMAISRKSSDHLQRFSNERNLVKMAIWTQTVNDCHNNWGWTRLS